MTKISNECYQRGLTIINFLRIFGTCSIKTCKNWQFFSSFNLFPSMPSVATDDRKQFQYIQIVLIRRHLIFWLFKSCQIVWQCPLNEKSKKLLNLKLKRKIVKFAKFVTAFNPGHKWCPRPRLETGPLDPGTSALIMRPPRLLKSAVCIMY